MLIYEADYPTATREEWYFDVRRDFIVPVQSLRREMGECRLIWMKLRDNKIQSAARCFTSRQSASLKGS